MYFYNSIILKTISWQMEFNLILFYSTKAHNNNNYNDNNQDSTSMLMKV